MTDLAELIERVERASGGDQKLDAALFQAMNCPLPEEFLGRGITLEWNDEGYATMPVSGMQVRYNPPYYTASIDAALSLVERMLPGTIGRIDFGPKCECLLCWWDADKNDRQTDAPGSTPALAILLALLKALHARREEC